MNGIAFATSNDDQGDTDGNDQQGSSNDNQSPDSFDQFQTDHSSSSSGQSQTDDSSPSSSDKSQSDQSPSSQKSRSLSSNQLLGSAFVGGLVGDAPGGPSGLLLSGLANGDACALQK
jgi:hypothetical protein